MPVSDPRVVITGASSGIGQALALEFARRHPDSRLLLLARRLDRLEALRARIAQPDRISVAAVDVTDLASLQAAGAAFIGREGRADIVVANAGVGLSTVDRTQTAACGAGPRGGATGADEGSHEPFGASPGTGSGMTADASRPRWDPTLDHRIMMTNWAGALNSFVPFVEPMRQARSGTLVGIASLAGLQGVPGRHAYGASKAALISSLDSLRVELRRDGIDVVTIAPGFARTPLTDTNRFRMPFLLEPDVFARRAVDAIEARRRFVVIPRLFGSVVQGVAMLPRAWKDRWLARAAD